MCGIVGYIGGSEAASPLIDGLKKLEYRGYDSAGVAVLDGRSLQVRRSLGKLNALESLLLEKPVRGHLGIAHTRWATHGVPSVANAHPHLDKSGQIAVVHNGIIENYSHLKSKLLNQGISFASETDTEVIAQLIGLHWNKMFHEEGGKSEESFVKAVKMALREIEGTYALGVVCSFCPDIMIGARRECPLILGLAEGGTLMASDVPAMIALTRDVIFLEDGDMAILNGKKPLILKEAERIISRAVARISWDPTQAEKGDYSHFMLKEIHEQPRVVKDTLLGRLHENQIDLKEEINLSEKEIQNISSIQLLACGTSWHAGLVGSYWIENLTRIPCQSNIASEFRYRNPPINEGTLVVAISQSGETADTLAAIRLAKQNGAKVVAIGNVVGSTLVREAHGNILTHCGPEIGVASTKAFMGQLVVLQLLALYLARVRKSIPEDKLAALTQDLARLPQWIEETLACEPQVKTVAEKYADRPNFLFLGRHLNYPIALEGALKLKEISYVHAEGYPAGEMKHGPIALIDEKMPVVTLATMSSVYEKILSNVEEARSRHGQVIAIASQGDERVQEKAADVIYVPRVSEFLSPMVNVVPLQILAYQIALLRGCDVDKPRNLAKSVTVE